MFGCLGRKNLFSTYYLFVSNIDHKYIKVKLTPYIILSYSVAVLAYG